jgi:hypothetical protein
MRSQSVSARQRGHAALTKDGALRSSGESGKIEGLSGISDLQAPRGTPCATGAAERSFVRNLTFQCQWDRCDERGLNGRIAARSCRAKVYRILKGTDCRVRACSFTRDRGTTALCAFRSYAAPILFDAHWRCRSRTRGAPMRSNSDFRGARLARGQDRPFDPHDPVARIPCPEHRQRRDRRTPAAGFWSQASCRPSDGVPRPVAGARTRGAGARISATGRLALPTHRQFDALSRGLSVE